MPFDPALDELGRRIRERRTELGLTQVQLGARLGVDRTYVSGIEQGRRNPKLVTVARIAAALDLDPGDLVAGLTDLLDD